MAGVDEKKSKQPFFTTSPCLLCLFVIAFSTLRKTARNYTNPFSPHQNKKQHFCWICLVFLMAFSVPDSRKKNQGKTGTIKVTNHVTLRKKNATLPVWFPSPNSSRAPHFDSSLRHFFFCFFFASKKPSTQFLWFRHAGLVVSEIDRWFAYPHTHNENPDMRSSNPACKNQTPLYPKTPANFSYSLELNKVTPFGAQSRLKGLNHPFFHPKFLQHRRSERETSKWNQQSNRPKPPRLSVLVCRARI